MTPMTALFLRVSRVLQAALELTAHVAGHLALSAALYPGLPGHPDRRIAAW
jgi:cystathionine beta-lyase/cystathionine gamma-synthase